MVPAVHPAAEDSLARLPRKLDTLAYLKYLAIAKTSRPVLRSYSVRTYRPDGPAGPELDVDFVLHGSPADGTAGPAAEWAETCTVGDAVAILDEGIGFNPPQELRRVLLVADESGLPAAAGILASLPSDTTGHAIVEIPDDDAQPVEGPDGVRVEWVVREDAHAVPGRAARARAETLTPTEPFYGWVVGEQTLPVLLRRHWIRAGVPKAHIMFCGYWRSGRGH